MVLVVFGRWEVGDGRWKMEGEREVWLIPFAGNKRGKVGPARRPEVIVVRKE